MTETAGAFLSCDWGTTSFRLRWIAGAEHKVVQEICESTGIKALHQEAVGMGATGEARAEVFSGFLRTRLNALLADAKPPQQKLPLVISGMASSSVGWRELPHAGAPFPLHGGGLRAEELHWHSPEWVGPTFLISGVATEHEMMRGEETEIIGLMAQPALAALRERCLLILPGTHSKHVRVENQCVIYWRTFMTGELFEVLGRQSLLRASIEADARIAGDSLSEAERAAFREGVLWAQAHGLAGGLFRVRTRAVLDRRPLAENTWFFSGLLIGAELMNISESACGDPIILAATRALATAYALALETVASPATQWIQLAPEQVKEAAVAGHALFLHTRGLGN